MALAKIGNLAPAFNTVDQNGNKFSLKDFRDKKIQCCTFIQKR